LLTKLNASKKCIEAIKTLFKLNGTDFDTVLKDGENLLKEYKRSLSALYNLREILDLTVKSGIKAQITVDLGFARGLEYYSGMIFEVYVPGIDIALNGGGRYDKLIELFGGEPTPAVGCAPGIDRINLAMDKQNLFPKKNLEKKILVLAINDELRAEALKIATQLRDEGLAVEGEILGKGVKKALSYANTKGYAFAVIIAPSELKKGNAIIRDMKKGTQEEVPIDELADLMKII
jgi:histidyl-tRNA synthetase